MAENSTIASDFHLQSANSGEEANRKPNYTEDQDGLFDRQILVSQEHAIGNAMISSRACQTVRNYGDSGLAVEGGCTFIGHRDKERLNKSFCWRLIVSENSIPNTRAWLIR